MLRKRQLEKQQLVEQQRIQQVLSGAVTKPQEIYGEDIMGQQVGEGMTAPSFDLQRAMPQLITSPEGRKALSDLIASQKAMAGDTFNLAEGSQLGRINPITGKTEILATGSPKREPVPSSIAEYNLAKSQGFTGTFQAYELAKQAVPSGSIKEFQDFSKLTPAEKTAYLKLQDQKRPVTNVNVSTEGERKASLFQEQMKAASGTIASLGPVDMSNLTNQAAFKGAGGLANIVVDPKIQQYKQAADQWSESYLRVKTGAAATPAEVELNNRTFFPAIGDNTETVKLKERMRKKAEQDLGIMAGRSEVKNPNAMPQVSEQPLDLGLSIPAGVTVKRKP
jgi:hypothetical protein